MQRPNAFITDHGRTLLLSAEQHAIITHQAPSAIIAALAGTGKTTTLACAAVQTLRARPNARILVLAYSKAGVEAFKLRLQMLLRHMPSNLHITTLERWCARTLRQRDPNVRFLTDPAALRSQVQQALQRLEEQLQRQSDPNIELPNQLDMQAFASFNHAAKKSLLLERLQEDGGELSNFCDEHMLDYFQARLFTAYERIRVDECGDIRYYAEGDCTYALAQEYGDDLQAPYDLVLFDEMHDLDLASLKVLHRILMKSGAQFLGAGDFNQHIEAQAWSVFRDKLHQLADFLPQVTQSLPLTQSRRFGSQIAQAVNRWFDVGMKATSSRHSTVTQWTYDSDVHCIEQLLQAQASIRQSPDSPCTTPLTILLRHAHEATGLEWAIHRAGKTVSLHGLQSFFRHRDIALLLGLIYAHSMQASDWKSSTCILDTDTLTAFVDGALYFGQGYVDAQQTDSELATMAAQMHAHPQGIWRFLLGQTSLQGGQRNFASFGKFLGLPLPLQNNAHMLLEQADLWGLFAATPMPESQRQQHQARVQNFMTAIAGLSVPQVLQDIATMTQRTQKIQRYGSGFDFQLISIEQAKGQEFDCVALPFLEPGRFPAPAARETAFLERNRMYVAMTRAKQRLWLIEHAQRPVQAFDH